MGVVTTKVFVKTILELKNIPETAKKLKLKRSYVYQRISKLRKLGVNIPEIPKYQKNSFNIAELNQMILESEKPAKKQKKS